MLRSLVLDHALHEVEIGVVRLDRVGGGFLGRQLARRLAGRAGLDDPWRRLGRLLVVGAAAAARGQRQRHRDQRPGTPSDHGVKGNAS
jgi:hypothetical protein